MDARFIYREAAVRGASRVRLVVLLYEQIIADLERAAKAMEQGNIEVRTRELNHALKVIAHLQGTLDIDRGGEVAGNLYKFYCLLQNELVRAQAQASRQVIQEVTAFLLSLREAWLEVEQAETSLPHPRAVPPTSPAVDSGAGVSPTWEG